MSESEKDNPTVAVVIPCFNLGAYLMEAVQSVLDQTLPPDEVVVVDDGSTDPHTKELISTLAQDSRVRVLSQENQGLAATRNNGIAATTSELVCCLDADDRLHCNYFERVTQEFLSVRSHNLGFVTTWAQLFGERSHVWKTSEFDPAGLIAENLIHVATVFRRSCWEEVSGYDTSLVGYQDWDFWLAIVARGYIWKTVKEPLFEYRVRPSSMITRSDMSRQEIVRKMRSKHRDFISSNVLDVIDALEAVAAIKTQRISDLNHSLEKTEYARRKSFTELVRLMKGLKQLGPLYRVAKKVRPQLESVEATINELSPLKF